MANYKSNRNGLVHTQEDWEAFISDLYSADAGVPEPADSWDRFTKYAQLVRTEDDTCKQVSLEEYNLGK